MESFKTLNKMIFPARFFIIFTGMLVGWMITMIGTSIWLNVDPTWLENFAASQGYEEFRIWGDRFFIQGILVQFPTALVVWALLEIWMIRVRLRQRALVRVPFRL